MNSLLQESHQCGVNLSTLQRVWEEESPEGDSPHMCVGVYAKSIQLCLTLYNPMDC